ncbi:hypothetical protein [Sporosarcina aquimarina]|uniref:Lipoprotein n=1 Tax=Sporosarcina aquimarina TaxID=114975 RepID=A0ABU4FZD9_9BACL|nr:hypothetical protein [Sporosarcina aquimarina]MDW0110089.1 hypothetical protein [Sporosarcina aquimarina]
MKRIGISGIVMTVALLLTGCLGGKSVTLTQRVLTEDERQLIYSAGGIEALHFTSEDTLSAGKTIQFSVEQFEQGEFVGTLAEMPWNGSSDGVPAHIAFGVQSTEEQAIDRILFSGPGELLRPELEMIPGGSTLLPGFEGELKLKQGESVYLAYYIVSSSGRVQALPVSEEEQLTHLKEYDRCLLLKAEWVQ